MIPKVMHQIWVGGPPPDWVQFSWKNWELLLPDDWTLRYWLDDEVADHPNHGVLFRIAEATEMSPRGLSNMLRVAICLEEGGLYADVDCLLMGEIDPLAGDRDSWIACAPFSIDMRQMENSCFGFRPGHPFLMEVLVEGYDAFERGVLADFNLGGSQAFRKVWDRQVWPELDVRWDYTTAGYVDLRRALRDVTTADRPKLLEKYGPFPIAHVWKPRL